MSASGGSGQYQFALKNLVYQQPIPLYVALAEVVQLTTQLMVAVLCGICSPLAKRERAAVSLEISLPRFFINLTSRFILVV